MLEIKIMKKNENDKGIHSKKKNEKKKLTKKQVITNKQMN